MDHLTTKFLIFLSLLAAVRCGDLTVAYAPPDVRFGSGGILRASSLDDVVVAALGYTPKASPWKGLTVTSPFAPPSAAVFIVVHGGGESVRQEGATYNLKEDTTLNDVFHDVKALIGRRAQRQTLFKFITVDDNLEDEGVAAHVPASQVLNATREPDSTYLQEMAALVAAAKKIENLTTSSHGGQDVIFLEVNALAPLVKAYGLNTPAVNEAGSILRQQLVKVTDIVRHLYGDSVLVVTATVDQLEELSRPSRSILQADDGVDLNEASEYSSDFPAVFNIVLWLSIILTLALLATSVAMATMDPGRDSIIYRMTNPRMKKDN